MTKILVTAFVALLAGSALEVRAQQASEICKPNTTEAACNAVAWCQWVKRKPISVDGKQIELASCSFKAGAKQAWTEYTKQQKQ